MGSLGWDPPTVDGMELWLIASYLGLADDGPVARGARGVTVPDDDAGGSPDGEFHDPMMAARSAELRALRAGKAP